MDNDCLSLLPGICVALADPKQSPPDDTSLEKLLDWFKELPNQSNGDCLLQQQPCLLEFISSVCKCKDTDHAILSFTLKLTGLLACAEQGFSLLEEKRLLVCVFEREGWCMPDLWHDASVRSGWLQGLLNMMNHRKALMFICGNGLIKVLLPLQNDSSLFVSSLANQVLVNILNLMTSSKISNNSDAVGSSQSGLDPDWVSVTSEIMSAVVEALGSEKHRQVIQGLKLLSLVLSQCGEPIRSMLWKDVLVPLEVLVNRGSGLFTQHLMTVFQAAVRSPLLSQSECKVEELMKTMLDPGNGKDCFQCAALIVKMEKCPDAVKRKAVNTVLLPLQCASMQTRDAVMKELKLILEEQLSQKSLCISLLLQSLSGVAELAHVKYQFEDIPSVTRSVMLLLKICSGHCPSSSLHITVSTHLIGCCKVQRCGLDTLGALCVYKENVDLLQEVFGVLLEYLQSPDSHATVLKKTLQATVKWVNVCSLFPDRLQFISHDLFPVLKKRMCDLRWEVRDSALEFMTQITVALHGNRDYIEALHTSDMFSALLSSLADVEGYVRASAVGAVGEAVFSSVQQTELLNTNVQEEVLTQMMAILSQDTEGFPRRAVVKAFTSWLKGPHPLPALDQSLSSVLSLGGNDLDWEVKIHTLELTDVLMEKALTCCPYAVEIFNSAEALCKLKDMGLFDLLLNSLFDCDRPVCEKACTLLLKLRKLETVGFDRNVVVLDVFGNRWGDEVCRRYLNKPQTDKSLCVMNGGKGSHEKTDGDLLSIKEISLLEVLQSLDLDHMQKTLTLSSDHVVNSPRSLMEDILSTVQQTEDNVIDCY